MPRKLTVRQREIFSFVEAYIHEKGYPPTTYEIGDAFGFSVRGACDHLIAIEKKGYISRTHNSPRSIIILKPSGAFPKQQIYRCAQDIPETFDLKKGDYIHLSVETGEIVGLTRVL